eukprot:10219717-Alexandrium_andersonii.AAC.1
MPSGRSAMPLWHPLTLSSFPGLVNRTASTFALAGAGARPRAGGPSGGQAGRGLSFGRLWKVAGSGFAVLGG